MRISFFTLAVLFGGGCTGGKLAVSNADRLLEYQVLKRIPLYSQQKISLSKDIDRFLNETKPMALEAVPVLDEINIEKKLSHEKQFYQLEAFYKRLVLDFSTVLSKYIALLDKKQQKDFLENLEFENLKMARKKAEDHFEEAKDRFIKFFGSITEQQKTLLLSFREYFHQRAEARLERRKQLHKDFFNIYAQDISYDSRKILIYEAFEKFQTEGLSNTRTLELIEKITPTLESHQKEHFRGKVQEIKSLLNYFIQADF